MDNYLPPFHTTRNKLASAVTDATTTTTTPSSILTTTNILIPANQKINPSPQNSHISICEPLGFASTSKSYYLTTHHEVMQFPSSYPLHHATCQSSSSSFSAYGFRPTPGGIGNEVANSLPNVISKLDEERRVLDAWTTKVARNKRRLARQRSLSLSRASSLPAFGCNDDTRGLISVSSSDANNITTNRNRNLFTFCTPDKKVLRMLLKKELRNSDVGSLGRIVLPKREAEENLPMLSDKEGIQVVIRDVNSHKKWAMKYKYWANNRSRMYVLENTGDFVRQNGLVIGDSMTLYEDECKNLYVSIKKAEKSVVSDNHSSLEENETNNNDDSATTYTNMDDVKDEEEASLALLIEELKHKAEDQEAGCDQIVSGNLHSCNINSFERGCYVSRRPSVAALERPSSSSSYMRGSRGKEVEELQSSNGFEDCFGGLDTLPEVSGFKCSLFEYLSNDDKT